MRVLLDECVDVRFAPYVTGFETRTVRDLSWSGITNGQLLTRAAVEFDVFVTVDRNLMFQQHLPKIPIAVVLLHCKSNRLAALVALVPDLLAAIPAARPGTVTHVGR